MKRGRGVPAHDVGAPEAVTFRYEFDEDESPTHALVTVVSAVTGTSVTEFGPLGAHVELDALENVIASTGDGGPLSASVVLSADGMTLTVRDTEIVGVLRRDVADWSQDDR